MNLKDLKSIEVSPDPYRYGYVYIILNIVNEVIYVGQHKKCQSCIKGKCKYLGGGSILSKAVQKYGKESFVLIPILNCYSPEELNIKEIEIIKDYSNSCVKMYNIVGIYDSYTRFENKIIPNQSELTRLGHEKRWEKEGEIEKSVSNLSDCEAIRLHEEGYSVVAIAMRYKINKTILRDRLINLSLECKPVEDSKKFEVMCSMNHRILNKTFPLFLDEELVSLYPYETIHKLHTLKRLSDKESASFLGISEKLFYRIRKLHKIKRPKLAHNKMSDNEMLRICSKDKLIEVYVTQNRSVKEVSRILNIKRKRVFKLLKFYDIRKSKDLQYKNRVNNWPAPERKLGDSMRSKVSNIDKAEFLKYYNQGFTNIKIASGLNIERDVVAEYLKANGLNRNSRVLESCFLQIGRIISKPELEDKLKEHKTVRGAAKALNLKDSTIFNFIKHYEIGTKWQD